MLAKRVAERKEKVAAVKASHKKYVVRSGRAIEPHADISIFFTGQLPLKMPTRGSCVMRSFFVWLLYSCSPHHEASQCYACVMGTIVV